MSTYKLVATLDQTGSFVTLDPSPLRVVKAKNEPTTIIIEASPANGDAHAFNVIKFTLDSSADVKFKGNNSAFTLYPSERRTLILDKIGVNPRPDDKMPRTFLVGLDNFATTVTLGTVPGHQLPDHDDMHMEC